MHKVQGIKITGSFMLMRIFLVLQEKYLLLKFVRAKFTEGLYYFEIAWTVADMIVGLWRADVWKDIRLLSDCLYIIYVKILGIKRLPYKHSCTLKISLQWKNVDLHTKLTIRVFSKLLFIFGVSVRMVMWFTISLTQLFSSFNVRTVPLKAKEFFLLPQNMKLKKKCVRSNRKSAETSYVYLIISFSRFYS